MNTGQKQRIIIRQAAEQDVDELADVNHLIQQLNPALAPLDRDQWASLIAAPETYIALAREVNSSWILGMGTLASYGVASGRKGWIEDVVVEADWRGKGVGRAIIEELLTEARRRGLAAVYLTSNPQREAANHLYRALGFVQRTTNCYRYSIS